MADPYCSCKLTDPPGGRPANLLDNYAAVLVLALIHAGLLEALQVSHGLQLQSPWRIPAAAVS